MTSSALHGRKYSYTREALIDVIEALGIMAKKRPTGRTVFVFPHENVVAIWWAKPATAPRFIGAGSEVNAA